MNTPSHLGIKQLPEDTDLVRERETAFFPDQLDKVSTESSRRNVNDKKGFAAFKLLTFQVFSIQKYLIHTI